MKAIYNFNYYLKNILKIEEFDSDEGSSFFDKLSIDINQSYIKFQIPKKDGMRDITAINRRSRLYKLQKNLSNHFLSKIPLSVSSKGFIKGNGYNDFLIKHIDKKFHMRLDIKDFFGSITEKHIRENLAEFVQDREITDNIVIICMVENKVPQGAVTSPTISNVIFRKIDQRIVKYCQSYQKVHVGKETIHENIIYTRYADDLLFSSDALDFKKNRYFLKMIKNILLDNGFKINYSKIYFSTDLISLSGFVVDEDLHLSRKKIKNINSILYYFDKRGNHSNSEYIIDNKKVKDPQLINKINKLNLKAWNDEDVTFSNKQQFINYLCGYRAFMISFLKSNIRETTKMIVLNKKVKRLENLIDKLSK